MTGTRAVQAGPFPLPRSLQVEVTAACNLRCRMCLVRYQPPVNRVTGSMPFARFRALVDELVDLEDITLQGLGEPLLAPDLLEMVRYASARGVTVGFNTNATLLTRSKAEALVDAGLDWLCVSLDGASAATYEAIRDGASFERVDRNLRTFADVRRARGTDRPRVSLVFVAMRRNVAELPALVRLAADYGVEEVKVQNLSHSFDDTVPESGYGDIREYTAREALWAGDSAWAEERFREAQGVADEVGITLHLPRLTEPQRTRPPGVPGCDWPWRASYVLHDGQVQPCCMVMGADRGVLGTVDGHSFAEVWNGPAYQGFREELQTDTPPTICQGCSLYRGVF